MRKTNPFLLTDFYKIVHQNMYPTGLTKLTSIWTPRMSRFKDIDKVVMFGLQGFVQKYLVEYFNDNFFLRDKEEVMKEYKDTITYTMGEIYSNTNHLEKLHDLGYLPLEIRAIKEGTRVPIKVPMIQLTNTHEDFAWLVNALETLISCHIWQPMTSASIAYRYREIAQKYYNKTVSNGEALVESAIGDFSMRGMSSLESAETSGAGFLLSLHKTATIPAIKYLETYYGANPSKEVIGLGGCSSEHSVMSSYGREELTTFNALLDKYPKGGLSLVSDTYDFWGLVTNILPQLKDKIVNREGKLLIRPDSGDPAKIICGSVKIIDLTNDRYCKTLEDCKKYMRDVILEREHEETPHGECGDNYVDARFKFEDKVYKITISIDWNRYDKQYYYMDGSRISSCEEISLEPHEKGVVECLWDIFGGVINDKGYKVLDSHIGVIYGDSITLDRASDIYSQLEEKGFSASNIIPCSGSFSYQYTTRDSFSFAMKATHAIIDGVETPIFKDPITDKDNFKKSQRGMCLVYKDDKGEITHKDNLTISDIKANKEIDLFETTFLNGVVKREQTLSEIRGILHGDGFNYE